jgi:hypothetical protein
MMSARFCLPTGQGEIDDLCTAITLIKNGADNRVTVYRGSQISIAGGSPPELFAFDAELNSHTE